MTLFFFFYLQHRKIAAFGLYAVRFVSKKSHIISSVVYTVVVFVHRQFAFRSARERAGKRVRSNFRRSRSADWTMTTNILRFQKCQQLRQYSAWNVRRHEIRALHAAGRRQSASRCSPSTSKFRCVYNLYRLQNAKSSIFLFHTNSPRLGVWLGLTRRRRVLAACDRVIIV